MSHLIADMKLGTPPVVVERLGNRNVTVWRGSCECSYRSKVYPRIGLVLEQMAAHGSLHLLERQEDPPVRAELHTPPSGCRSGSCGWSGSPTKVVDIPPLWWLHFNHDADSRRPVQYLRRRDRDPHWVHR